MTGSTYLCATSHIPAGSRLKDSLISLKYGLMQYTRKESVSLWWLNEATRFNLSIIYHIEEKETAGRRGVGVRRWHSKPFNQSYISGLPPASNLSFSHVATVARWLLIGV